MSIAGRNAIRGAVVRMYRAVHDDAPEGGGELTTTWLGLLGLQDVKLEIIPVTEEISREVFGLESNVEAMAMVPRRIGVAEPEPADALVVFTGPYAAHRFRIGVALPFRKNTQIGLVETDEAIP